MAPFCPLEASKSSLSNQSHRLLCPKQLRRVGIRNATQVRSEIVAGCPFSGCRLTETCAGAPSGDLLGEFGFRFRPAGDWCVIPRFVEASPTRLCVHGLLVLRYLSGSAGASWLGVAAVGLLVPSGFVNEGPFSGMRFWPMGPACWWPQCCSAASDFKSRYLLVLGPERERE